MRLSKRILLYLFVLATTLSCTQDAELPGYEGNGGDVILFANQSVNSRAASGMSTDEAEAGTQSFDGGSMGVMVSDMPAPDAVQATTRGASITTSSLSNCGVMAYQSNNTGFASAYPESPDIFMNHQKVDCTYDTGILSNNCTYSPLRFWPIGKYLNFYAYAPYTTYHNTTGGLTATPNTNGLSYSYSATDGPQITYAMPTTATKQVDLMCATPQLDKHTQSAKLNLDFKHQLAMVGFRVSGLGYTLKDLLITGIENEATLKMEDMTWKHHTTSKAINYKPGFNFTTSTGLALSSTPQLIQNEDGYLMVIPQQITSGATLKITYIYSGSSVTKSLDLSTVTTQWEAGKKYIYDIVLGEKGIWYRIDSDSDDDWVLWDDANKLANNAPQASISLDIRSSNGAVVDNNRLVSMNNYLNNKCPNPIDVDMSLAVNWSNTMESRFQAQSKLKSMALPKNITVIGANCFLNCSNLEKITGTDNVTIIDKQGFKACTKLKEISSLSKVQSIGFTAFQDCEALERISDLTELTEIGREAFRRCYALQNYPHMPKLTTWVGIQTFSDCLAIESITVPYGGATTIPERTFSGCQSAESITFGEGITTLGAHCVRNASNGAYGSAYATFALKTITLPSTMASIGQDAFRDCDNVTEIYCYAKVPPSAGANAFNNVGQKKEYKTLHVPASAVDVYKSTDPWKQLINAQKFTIVGDLP